ncbi:MAG: hypothetical protein ACLUNO_06880 [Oscillospiraceae bacterium]
MRRYEYAAKNETARYRHQLRPDRAALCRACCCSVRCSRRILTAACWCRSSGRCASSSCSARRSNLTLGYLGQLTLGHMGFAGVGAYTAALTSLALERAGLFEASKAAPGQLILVILGCCLLGPFSQGCSDCSWASRRCGCTATIWPS